MEQRLSRKEIFEQKKTLSKGWQVQCAMDKQKHNMEIRKDKNIIV